jgi:hypothetical protein
LGWHRDGEEEEEEEEEEPKRKCEIGVGQFLGEVGLCCAVNCPTQKLP